MNNDNIINNNIQAMIATPSYKRSSNKVADKPTLQTTHYVYDRTIRVRVSYGRVRVRVRVRGGARTQRHEIPDNFAPPKIRSKTELIFVG
jgi:hypothetical protein